MDEADILKSSGLSVGVIAIIYVVIKIVKSLNNKRFHSKCNGKDIVDVVIDFREATEEDKKPTPKPSPAINAITADKKISELNI
jgi:hypothetical protein